MAKEHCEGCGAVWETSKFGYVGAMQAMLMYRPMYSRFCPMCGERDKITRPEDNENGQK